MRPLHCTCSQGSQHASWALRCMVVSCICGQAWCTQVCGVAARGLVATKLAEEMFEAGEAVPPSVQCCATHCSSPACPQLKTMTPDQRAAAERAQQVALRLLASGPQASSLQQPSMSMAMPSAPTNINPVVAAAQAAAMAVAQKVHCPCRTPCSARAASPAVHSSLLVSGHKSALGPCRPAHDCLCSACLLACDRCYEHVLLLDGHL